MQLAMLHPLILCLPHFVTAFADWCFATFVGTSKFTWTIHRALGSILQIRDSHPDFWPTGQRRCTSYRYRLGRGHFAFEIIVSILFWV